MRESAPSQEVMKSVAETVGHLSAIVNCLLDDDPDDYRNQFQELPNGGIINQDSTGAAVLELIRQQMIWLLARIEAAKPTGRKTNFHEPSAN